MNTFNCQAYNPRDDLSCANCGADITQHDSPQDVPKLENAADKVIKLCDALGLSRDEMATLAHSIALNHFVATGVSERNALLATKYHYRWRTREGNNERVLVKRPSKIEDRE